MSEIFQNIPVIRYEGPDSTNPFAFKYYDPERVVMGKKMKDQLPFAMAWWHNLCANGVDMFGRGTADKRFGAAEEGTMEHAKAKVDAGIEFMKKLGIEYYCFHDVDLVPEADDINETNRRLDEIGDYILEKTKGTNIKCLWGTANMFSNPRFMNGAGSTNDVDVYCFAAAQVKKAIELTVKLGGRGYVFWGGRIEGYTEEKYSSFDSDLGKRIRKGETTLAELAARAALLKRVDTPISGKQEYLEGVLNNIILSGK